MISSYVSVANPLLHSVCHCSNVSPCAHMPAVAAAAAGWPAAGELHCASAAWQKISPENSCGCSPAWKLTWHTRASPGSRTPAGSGPQHILQAQHHTMLMHIEYVLRHTSQMLRWLVACWLVAQSKLARTALQVGT
jgi:hypothetical protein